MLESIKVEVFLSYFGFSRNFIQNSCQKPLDNIGQRFFFSMYFSSAWLSHSVFITWDENIAFHNPLPPILSRLSTSTWMYADTHTHAPTNPTNTHVSTCVLTSQMRKNTLFYSTIPEVWVDACGQVVDTVKKGKSNPGMLCGLLIHLQILGI